MAQATKTQTEGGAKAAKAPMDKKTKIAIGILGGIVLLIIIAAIVISSLQSAGVFLRSTVGLSSEHFEVNNAMLSYYLYQEMYDRVEANPDLYEEHGLDMSAPLRDQMFNESATWFDYFMNIVVPNAKEYLMLAEAAYEAELTLDLADYDSIDRDMAALEAEAEAEGTDYTLYLRRLYGKGIKEEDIRDAKELYLLAEKQSDSMTDALTYDEGAITTFYENYRQLFLTCDVMFYSVVADTEDMEDEDEIAQLRTEAKEQAQALLDCTDADSFLANCHDHIYATYDTVAAEEKYENILHTDYTYVSDNKMSSWLFAETREDGDKTVITFNDDRYTAVYVVKAAESDDSNTRNVRVLSLDYGNYENSEEQTLAKANEYLDSFLAGNATEDAFTSLVVASSEDEELRLQDGLDANLEQDDEQVYAAWAYEEGRKVGDTAVLSDDDGVYVVYYSGEGRPIWQNTAEDYLRADDYSDAYDEIAEAYTVTATQYKYMQVKERED